MDTWPAKGIIEPTVKSIMIMSAKDLPATRLAIPLALFPAHFCILAPAGIP